MMLESLLLVVAVGSSVLAIKSFNTAHQRFLLLLTSPLLIPCSHPAPSAPLMDVPNIFIEFLNVVHLQNLKIRDEETKTPTYH